MAEQDERTAKKQALLEALPLTETLTEALRLTDLPSGTYHRWRQEDPAWATQVDAVRQHEMVAPAPDPMSTPLVALRTRVERLEDEVATLRSGLRRVQEAVQACFQERQTARGLSLWAQRTQGRTRGPLTALLALGQDPPEGA